MSATATVPGRHKRTKTIRFLRNNAAILLIYLLILLVGGGSAIISDSFLTSTNITNILRQSIPLGLAAIGQSLVLLTGGMDISVGMVARMTGLVVATMIVAGGGNPLLLLLALPIGILVGVGVGVVNGLLITRTKAVPFIVTFGVFFILWGINSAISSMPIRLGDASSVITQIYFAQLGPIPYCIFGMAIIWILMWFFTTRTRFGRNIYAVGGSERIARLSAIKINRTTLLVYVLCSVFAALAGLFLLARGGVGNPTGAENLAFQSIVAGAVGGISLYGGRGSMIGVLGGVLLITLVLNAFTLTGNALSQSIPVIGRYFSFSLELVLGLIVLIAVSIYTSSKGARGSD